MTQFGLISDVQSSIGKIANARREPESQQVAKTKHMVSKPCRICVVFFDSQVGFMVKQPIENMEIHGSRPGEEPGPGALVSCETVSRYH